VNSTTGKADRTSPVLPGNSEVEGQLAGPSGTPAPVAGLAVTRAARLSFGPGQTPIDDAEDVSFLTELAAQEGFELDRDRPRSANPYRVMGQRLVAELGEVPEVGMVIVSYAAPDAVALQLSGPALAELVPGHPTVLGVGDQGRSTAFSMLDVACGYARRHGVRSVLAFAFDQAVLPYRAASDVPPLPSGDAAVALLLQMEDDIREDGCAVVWRGALSRAAVAGALSSLLDHLDPRREMPVIAGADLPVDGQSLGDRTLRWQASGGWPGTELLAEAVTYFNAPTLAPVLLAEYDPYLCVAAVCRLAGPARWARLRPARSFRDE
jgi:hypothetical protein